MSLDAARRSACATNAENFRPKFPLFKGMETRRRLPHEYPEGNALFLTWHLHGAVPSSRFPPPGKLPAGQAFVYMDRYLDTTRQGPLYLRMPEIARIMVQSLQAGQSLGHYELHAWVIMPNHVHMLIDPQIDPSRLMRSLKGASAREANRAMNRTGEPFWQKESYDHWVRDVAGFERIRAYIENNPVKAGLVRAPHEYTWSSANVQT
jgi:REP-associated tyrosine transposase